MAVVSPSWLKAPTATTVNERPDYYMNSYVKTKVNTSVGVNALKDIAQTEAWSWHGTTYCKKTKGARPHKGSLNLHSEVLRELIRLAPTTRLSRYSLRDILFQLHIQTGIFNGIARERSLKLHEAATVAADRWCIMLRHCLVLCRLGGPLDEEKGLDECIKLIDADEHWKMWPLRSAKPTSSAADTAFPPPSSAETTGGTAIRTLVQILRKRRVQLQGVPPPPSKEAES